MPDIEIFRSWGNCLGYESDGESVAVALGGEVLPETAAVFQSSAMVPLDDPPGCCLAQKIKIGSGNPKQRGDAVSHILQFKISSNKKDPAARRNPDCGAI